MQRIILIRRATLSSYNHYDLTVEIEDTDESRALTRALEVMKKAYASLGIEDKIEVEKQ